MRVAFKTSSRFTHCSLHSQRALWPLGEPKISFCQYDFAKSTNSAARSGLLTIIAQRWLNLKNARIDRGSELPIFLRALSKKLKMYRNRMLNTHLLRI